MALTENQWLTNSAFGHHVNLVISGIEHLDPANDDNYPPDQKTSIHAHVREDNEPLECCKTGGLPEAKVDSTATPIEENKDTISPSAQTPSSDGHHIHDARERPLSILVAGAGPSGIALAIELLKLPNVTFQIFEKNHDVGGTWLENRYPGAACDIASHAYQYTFEQNTEWSHHFAPAEEIGEYFKKVARKHAVYPHVHFNSKVNNASWDAQNAKWVVRVIDTISSQESEVSGDLFINAGGILNDWKWPDIPGLDTFKGHRVHTAAWDPTLSLRNKTVGVIGSGATSVQVVPSIQPVVDNLKVFIRSPTYILPTVGFGVESSEFNERYSDEQKKAFRDDPEYYRSFRKSIEQQMNENFVASRKGTKQQEDGRKWAENAMRKAIASKELQDKLIPSWEFGCRRLTPGLPYLNAVQQPNVEIVRTPIDKICEQGIQTSDGQVHEFDVLICATGFDTSFSARYDIVGQNQRSLRDLWKDQLPEAYLGLAISGYPNYFTFLGPNCPIANGSLIPCIESSARYISQVVEKMQRCQIRTVNVKADMQRAFNDYIQHVHRGLVWTGACTSWYKDRATNKITAVWPGSSIHYMEFIEQPRWEDFDIEYQEGNPFKFLGDGRSQREFQGKSLTFYLD